MVIEAETSLTAEADPGGQPQERGAKAVGEHSVVGIFNARLMRRSREEPLGIKADFADDRMLHVCRLTTEGDTPVARHNREVPPSQRLAVGDYILSVNGQSRNTVGAEQKVSEVLRDQLLSGQEVVLAVSRPRLFDVEVQKDDGSLGLELTYSNSGISLVVGRIALDGLVHTQCPEVRSGDRIVAVNGVEGGPEPLLQAVRSASNGLMRFTFSRAACEV